MAVQLVGDSGLCGAVSLDKIAEVCTVVVELISALAVCSGTKK